MQQQVSGEERLAAICQMIRSETLDPAKHEAEQLKIAAEQEGERIKEAARKEAERLLMQARKGMSDERQAFEASLIQAARQTEELLKQKVEKALFAPQLTLLLDEEFSDEQKTAHILDLIIASLREEGVKGDLSAWIGKRLNREAVLKYLTASSLKALPPEGVKILDHSYGVVIKILDRHLSLEITPDSLRDLLARFLRADFRKYVFQE